MEGKRRLLILYLVILGVFCGVQQSFGTEFAFSEGGARGSALAGTLVGRADDPSALFYNPAGITQLPGLQMMIGAAGVFNGSDSSRTITIIKDDKRRQVQLGPHDASWVPPHFYTTYQYNDRVWFGFGVFSQYGVNSIFSLRSMTLNPNVAIKMSEKLSVALGLNIETFYPSEDNSDELLLDASDAWSYGFNLGMHYRLSEQWAFGATYRNLLASNFDRGPEAPQFGTVIFSVQTPSAPSTHLISLGIAFYPLNDLSLEAGAIWAGEVRSSVMEEAWRLQFGAEYKVKEWLDLRAGYAFDEDPSPKGSLFLDGEKFGDPHHFFSFGPGFHWRDWTVDLSYSYVHIPGGREGPEDGEDDHAQVIGMSIGRKF